MHISVSNSGKLIADNLGIKYYIKEEYNRTDAEIIEYGGDQVTINKNIDSILIDYPFLNDEYILALGRIQSDNNIEMLLEAFKDTNKKFVYIGNWNVSNYSKFLLNKYSKFSNLILLDAIYDLETLDIIRSNCKYYIHAHSAGGTNPSLVEAMHYKIPILCYDNIFNNYTTKDKSFYFKNKDQLLLHLNNLDLNPKLSLKIANDLYLIAQEFYTWKSISSKYFNFIIK
jgi:glycosyltransferase involved in cell wall biosynthesis